MEFKTLNWNLIKIALGAVFISFVLHFLYKQLPVVTNVFRDLNLSWFMSAVLLNILAYAVIFWRLQWFCVAFGSALAAFDIFKASYCGFFVNQFTPTGIGGDAYKIVVLGKKIGWKKATFLILLDRISGFVYLVLFGALVFVFGTIFSSFPANTLAISIGTLTILVAMFGIMGFLPERFSVSRIVSWATGLLKSVPGYQLSIAIRCLTSVKICAISITFYLLSIFALLACFFAANATSSWLNLFFLSTLILCLAAVPISFGPWGLRETSAIAVSGQFSLAPEIALVASIAFGLSLIVASIPGGFLLLLFKKGERN